VSEEPSVIVYCENDHCRVLLFSTRAKATQGEVAEQENCPGCGQFGRTKGK
jgi:hypothetical protein